MYQKFKLRKELVLVRFSILFIVKRNTKNVPPFWQLWPQLSYMILKNPLNIHNKMWKSIKFHLLNLLIPQLSLHYCWCWPLEFATSSFLEVIDAQGGHLLPWKRGVIFCCSGPFWWKTVFLFPHFAPSSCSFTTLKGELFLSPWLNPDAVLCGKVI